MSTGRTKVIVIVIVAIVVVLALTIALFRLTREKQLGSHADEHAHTEGKLVDSHDDHGASEEHGEDDENGEHEEHGHEAETVSVSLTAREIKDADIKIAVARAGKLHIQKKLIGEVVLNQDRLAHVVPLVPGVVREVRKNLGDTVKAGEVMAIIDSRELAESKASFLAARERRELAASTFKREEGLWQKKISSEQEYLDAKQALAAAEIDMRAAEQALYALGLSEEELRNLSAKHERMGLTRYAVTAPLDGTVIGKHIALGEKITKESDIFMVADLSTVWVDLNIPQKDLVHIKKGQQAVISAGPDIPNVQGTIAYLAPIIDERTRTALARIEISRKNREWRPGLFVTAHLTVDEVDVRLLIPKTAVQQLDSETIVFLETAEGLAPQDIEIGRSDKTHVEVLAGITAGQRYVVDGAFELKAKIITSNIDAHAGHGH